MFGDWMLSCGHQIRCAVHDQQRPDECDCSARGGARATPGNPVCLIPHEGGF